MRTVLVVDDDADVRTGVRETLEGEGFAVLTAANGLEALRILEHFRPHAIVLDIDMPVMNGRELLWVLDSRRDLARIPRLIASGLDLSSSEHRLPKPFGVRELVEAVCAL